ncbi:hypothetical protein QI155_10445 [Thermodesulfovibrio sp. 1176]|uniref:hypothetical protein n=1 Tax=Thermodesulfovibrio sp. 1176 TaxID=3043424 RepID=UPI0024824633|nr:hypothetical protein [Thermodesulfovibrio sp. 1176]MDI1472950.1 hypothetical protein [Thermodesulfovibrio sp. 1176]
MEVISTRKFEEIDEKCVIKKMYGKCMIPLKNALFCLDRYTIHMQARCPNCCSLNQVRLIELFLSTYDDADPTIEKVIQKFLRG